MGAQDHIQAFRIALDHISKDGVSGPLVANMMVKCRKVLETHVAKKTYPIANLFGNWAVHTELSTDKSAIEILDELNDLVVERLHGKDVGQFQAEITHRLKLEELRLELIAICNAFHVPQQTIADKSSWAAIKYALLGELCANRLVATAKQKSALPKRYPGAHMLVIGFEITNDPKYLCQFPDNNPRFCYIVDVAYPTKLDAEPIHLVTSIVGL